MFFSKVSLAVQIKNLNEDIKSNNLCIIYTHIHNCNFKKFKNNFSK